MHMCICVYTVYVYSEPPVTPLPSPLSLAIILTILEERILNLQSV